MMKEFCYDDLCEISVSDSLTEVEDVIIEHGRWSVLHRIIFREEESGKYYEWLHSVGATEMQDEWPYSPGQMEECEEVHPVEKLVVVYE